MPILIDERIITLEFADLACRRPITRPDLPPRRADGLHQSGILAYIARKIGKLKPDERDEDEYPMIFAMGQMWEEFIFSFYPEIKWQPGERSRDAIHVNCDGITPGVQVEEAKATFKGVMSGEDFIHAPKQWIWQHQGREYNYQYDYLQERWHVFHVRGDYKTFGPVYKTYTVGYTRKEVERTHEMLLLNAEAARAEGAEEKAR